MCHYGKTNLDSIELASNLALAFYAPNNGKYSITLLQKDARTAVPIITIYINTYHAKFIK